MRELESGKPVLDLAGVDLVRGGTPILSGVNWRILRGEHWALLGANGSGKTTLLKVITGYEWPTSGSVTVLDNHHGDCDIRALRRHIGWVSSSLEHRLPPEERAVDVVLSGIDASIGVYRQYTEAEHSHAREMLRRVGGGSVSDRQYGVLSQGEQQRVLIARALIARPDLLILDEPCAGLDPAARARFLDDLGVLVKEPQSPNLVLVTHHVEEIGRWINRVLMLKSGRVLASGAPGEVLTDATLSRAFDAVCHVTCRGGGFQISVASSESGVGSR
ncbi:MAG: ABC transporter ATP-binding protein [Candidatus Hydrogenedentes bacterium]|nr:ABC transporter ATP-binding protein [Candidatus Hydrogenedentota bacterium]